ncbi:MAG: GNAT family N-acetyltransferase [Erythrobacter sp.]
MSSYIILPDDLNDPRVLDLLRLHLEEMHSWSPPESVHALPPEKLRADDVAFFAAWEGERLAAVGALKALGADCGELKSMRAAPEYRGKGAGEAILHHLLAEARARGYRWVGLETGRPAPFQPAQSLYRKHGFAECAPFGNYVSDGFSLCMEKHL